jgi:hypothetical protein
LELNETKIYHNIGMVAKFNPVENSWHFNKSGGVKLLAWPQTLD